MSSGLTRRPEAVEVVRLQIDVSGAGGVVRRIGELGGKAVEISAPCDRLTFDLLEEMGSAAANAGVSLGIVPQVDRSRTRGRRPMNSGDRLIFDAIGHNHGDGRAVRDVREELSRPTELLILLAHGDGMHMNLRTAVLCGLQAAHEMGPAGPIPGGCQGLGGACKKAREIPVVIRSRDLNCEVLCLLSCTSLSLASQLFSSDLSIALAAWRSGAARNVIGTARQSVPRMEEALRLQALLMDGVTLGAALLAINRSRDLAADGPLLLLGDPTWRSSASTLEEGEPPAPDARPVTKRRRTPDAATERLRRQLLDSARIENAASILVRRAMPPGHDLRRALEELRSARLNLEDALWIAQAHAYVGSVRPSRLDSFIMSKLVAWQQAAAHALSSGLMSESQPGSAVGDMFLPALDYFLNAGDRRDAGTECPHCGGRVFVSVRRQDMEASSGSLPERLYVECNGCGPLAHIAADMVPATHEPLSTGLRLVSGNAPGSVARFELISPYDDCVAEPVAFLQVRDKTRHDPLPAVSLRLALNRIRHSIEFPIPASAGSDIFSARLVVLRDAGFDYFRCLFSVLPPVRGIGDACH